MAISDAVLQSTVASVVGIKTAFQDLRAGNIIFKPQMIALVGQGSSAATYSTDKLQVTSSNQVGETYGFGSPLHKAAQQLFPTNGDGVGTIPVTAYALEDDVSGVVATGDIIPSGAQTEVASYQIKVNNTLSKAFTIAISATVADIVTSMALAVNSVLDMPVIATDATPGTSTQLDITSKWKGISANDIFIEVVESASAGTIFTVTQPAGGLINPTVDAALALIGNVWESLLVNCLDSADTIAFDAYSDFGEGRWGALEHKPLVVITGNNIVDPTTASAVSEARKATDRTNSFAVAPGSKNLPCEIAARLVARIAPTADSHPSRGYQSQNLSGITPGLDTEQWDHTQRDLAVKRGCSTIEVIDGQIEVSDVVTFWHPDSEPVPAYRYVVTIIKLQNTIFNTFLIFNTDSWKGAPLIPDDQATAESYAKKPRMAKAAIASMVDSLALYAIVSDPETIKAGILAQINDMNPNRLDVSWTAIISGNANIISIDTNFGFYFGETVVVA